MSNNYDNYILKNLKNINSHENKYLGKITVIFNEMKFQTRDILQKLNISKYFELLIIIPACCLIWLGVFECFLSSFIAVFYLLMGSIKSFENDNLEADKMILTCWTVFSFYFIIETFMGYILGMIPSYHFIKAIFFIYLYLPNTKGAIIIYDKYIKSTFIKCENNVNKLLTDLQQDTNDISKNAQDLFTEHNEIASMQQVSKDNKNENEYSKIDVLNSSDINENFTNINIPKFDPLIKKNL